jgi:hypothetical protein
MKKVNCYRTKSQANLNAEICASIYIIGNQNGGLTRLAERAGMNYWTLWNQVNQRTKEVPASTIPKVVNASDNDDPLQILCKACGYIAVREIEVLRNLIPLDKHLLSLPINVGSTLYMIEKAFESNRISRREYKEINAALTALRKLGAELDLRIKEEARL